MSNHLVPNFIDISVNEYHEFIRVSSELKQFSPDISHWKNEVLVKIAKRNAADLFEEKILLIKKALTDKERGIVAVDIAESAQLTPDENAYWGVAVSLALTANVFHPSKDQINQTPFTLHAASYQSSKKLEEFGLGVVSPETKLGFHTDGAIHGETVYMPKNLMLYNLVIEYKKPGNFYWVPFKLWSEKNIFMNKIGIGKRYRIKLTPSIYEADDGRMENIFPHEIEAPIFFENADLEHPLYLNGKVIGACGSENFDVSLVDDLKDSIGKNAVRYAVPQKTRRAIFVCNLIGAHARDIFEEAIDGVHYTRVLMRSVDTDSINLHI